MTHNALRRGSVTMARAGLAPTLVTANPDERRIAFYFHALRLGVSHLVADCEWLLDILHRPERDDWRQLVERAFLAARQLLAFVDATAPGRENGSAPIPDALRARFDEPQRRILDAMAALLKMVPSTVEDELVLHDAGRIRQTAQHLLAGDSRSVWSTIRGDHAAPPVPPPNEPRDQPGVPRILVVDDEKLLRTLLSRLVTGLGYQVTEADNGKQASELLEQGAFDAILTDINMPKLDGIELLRLVKGAPKTRDIPVIVVSSQDDLPSVAKCIELGAEDHISKPYEPLILKARLRASLERKRLRDLELHHLRRLAEITAAAEAVERETYVPGSIAGLMTESDGIGQLARVFDRMVRGLKSREERLHHRLRQLRAELGNTSGRTAAAANVSTESPFASGEILAARYEILGHLGQGGMGTVYHVRDMELGEEIALKVVRRDLVRRDPTLVDRLKSESRLARKISHRNVVRTHDLGEWQGTYFITMEFVRGISVAELLDRRGRLSVASTLAIGTQLAEALTVAHEEQIVHRDIKPANLLVDEGGVLKVMDFGLARHVDVEAHLTAGGWIVGTPQYMAPEQLMGGHVDARSDLFAVGVVLYECLAGKPPYVADSPLGLVTQAIEGNVLPLDECVEGVPPYLASLIRQLIQADPVLRIGSAKELAGKLAETDHAMVGPEALDAGS